MSNFRLLQLMIFAGVCLLLLKTTSFLLGGGGLLTGQARLQAQDNKKVEAPQKTGRKGEAPVGDKKADAAKAKVNDKGKTKVEMAMGPELVEKPANFAVEKVSPSNAELDLLESLAQRRKQLNQRETQLKLKENLLKAAQTQVEERIEQLKALEAKIQVDLKKQDVLQKNQYQRLVKIYSSMKAKEAARIFNGLDMPILVDLMQAMKASAGSQIIAKMDPEKARTLTLLLARKSQNRELTNVDKSSDLPVIKGEKPAAKNK